MIISDKGAIHLSAITLINFKLLKNSYIYIILIIIVLPVTEALIPCRCSAETRNKWKERYRYTKKYGIRVVFAGVTSTGLVTVAKEACAYGVNRHAKR